MKRFLTAPLAALTLLLLLGGGAQAAPIPPDQISWTYNWSRSPVAVFGDAGGNVNFTDEPTKVAKGSSRIVATNIRVASTATAAAPESVVDGNYALSLTLATNSNGNPYTATLTFHGTLSGTFSAENANVANAFGPDSSQFVDLGSFRFTVDLVAYTPPGPPDQSNAGSIGARVTVEDRPPVVNETPEPSTMLLGGLGLTFLGGAAWRKRRKARARS